MKTRTIILLSSLFIVPSVFPQGSLTPPGPPGPTMQTLDQLGAKADAASAKLDSLNAKAEPRIPLEATRALADDNYDFIISQAGSYILTANVSVSKPNGIKVTAAGVRIDLQGFTITRSSGTGGNGIEIAGTAHDLVVENGSITGFANGTVCPDGISSATSVRGGAFRNLTAANCSTIGLQGGAGWRLENCGSHDNGGTGISGGNGSVFSHCTATSNAGVGISAGSSCTISHCAATDNLGTAGIATGIGANISYCVASSNSGSTAISAGFLVGDRSTIIFSTATDNGSSFATPSGGTGAGFSASGLSLIAHCVAVNNKGDGIRVALRSRVVGNECDINGTAGGDGAGIHATGDKNRIEDNDVTNSDRGIDVDGVGNFIARNTATGNTTNYDIAIGNSVGPIVATTTNAAAISGSTASSTLNSNDPWANFSH